MNRNKTCSIALVGFGGAGAHHLNMLKTTDYFTVAGIYDIDPARCAVAIAEGYNVFSSLDAMLQDLTIDAVLIATPNDSHKDISIAALKAGKHVICEKPVTLNSEELSDILEVAQSVEKHFIVHQNRRWDPDYLIIKEIFNKKMVGEVYNLQTRAQGAIGVPRDWRLLQKCAGGMLFDWGVHLIDRSILLFDERILSVYCRLSYITGEEVDDGFKLLINLENNKSITIEVGTNDLIKLPMWYMNGINGAAIVEGWNLNGYVIERKEKVNGLVPPILAGVGVTRTLAPLPDNFINKSPLPEVKGNIIEFYENAYDCFMFNKAPLVRNDQVMRVMKIMEAAIQSHNTNSAIACYL
ncbi:Gfo/Idh/MocA family oxidoreductase [Klebsiella pneumoniae]|nr:Gfo/Idh/MocA family oxidoreductase [Klebsiella pneumoniae]